MIFVFFAVASSKVAEAFDQAMGDKKSDWSHYSISLWLWRS